MSLREGRMIRPLLGCPKPTPNRWPNTHGWSWREDPSNESKAYLRNRIRHEVLPLMDDLRPGTTSASARAGTAHAELLARLVPLIEDARREAEVQPGSWSTDVLDERPLAQEALQRMLKHAGWSHVGRSNGRGLGPVDVSGGQCRGALEAKPWSANGAI